MVHKVINCTHIYVNPAEEHVQTNKFLIRIPNPDILTIAYNEVGSNYINNIHICACDVLKHCFIYLVLR